MASYLTEAMLASVRIRVSSKVLIVARDNPLNLQLVISPSGIQMSIAELGSIKHSSIALALRLLLGTILRLIIQLSPIFIFKVLRYIPLWDQNTRYHVKTVMDHNRQR